jgi:hypothetical protein
MSEQYTLRQYANHAREFLELIGLIGALERAAAQFDNGDPR